MQRRLPFQNQSFAIRRLLFMDCLHLIGLHYLLLFMLKTRQYQKAPLHLNSLISLKDLIMLFYPLTLLTSNNILGLKYLYVGWQRLSITEHISVLQCSLCGRLGHTRGRCPFPLTSCKTCASDSLDGDHVNNCSRKCINCVEANANFKLSLPTDHRPNNSGCSRLQRARVSAVGNIDYGP